MREVRIALRAPLASHAWSIGKIRPRQEHSEAGIQMQGKQERQAVRVQRKQARERTAQPSRHAAGTVHAVPKRLLPPMQLISTGYMILCTAEDHACIFYA